MPGHSILVGDKTIHSTPEYFVLNQQEQRGLSFSGTKSADKFFFIRIIGRILAVSTGNFFAAVAVEMTIRCYFIGRRTTESLSTDIC